MSAAPLQAVAALPPTADLAGIVRAVGADPTAARYDNGELRVRGVTQEALEAAITAADPLASNRTLLRMAAGAELMRHLAAGMPWREGKVLQIDEASLNRITSAATGAQAGALPAGFSWRMADNSALSMDAPGMIAMAAAALAYVYALRARYWQIVDEVRVAADETALAAVSLAGWPDPPAPPG